MTEALVVLGTALLGCLVSAFAPIPPAEPLLLGLSLRWDGPDLVLAVLGAIGQMAGKMVFFLAGAGVVSSRLTRRSGRPRGRWAARMERVQGWCERRWYGPVLVVGVSAVVGLPPFAVVCVLAGTLRMRWWVFLSLGLVGRSIRFAAVLAGLSFVL